MAHTPGPWKILKSKMGDYAILHNGIIAEVYYRTDDDVFVDAEANARLIAAAPALLEACKMAQFLFVEGNDVFEGLQEATAYMKKTKVALDKALAQAKG